ncbi:isochorismatase family cysteine hydrolase [Metamycoplasma spumans]|uniref:isochorismatase family cysteine hydrolase n=1 Tax=Metamycoplasma spumans TaxID=92406 RepID=UPI0034DD8582
MKKIMFVIDMLNGFTKFGPLSSDKIKDIIPNIEKHLAKNQDIDNIFICDAHSEEDVEMKSYPVHCLKNSEEAEVVDELKPFIKKKIEKQSTNGFLVVPKEIWNSYDEFEVVGCCSDICVLQFALSLKTYLNQNKLDKNVIVYKDMIATFDLENHNYIEFNNIGIKLMKNSGILVK